MIEQPLKLNDDHLGLYIHIPFCLSKCYYCDFVSFACGKNYHTDYLHAIKKEAEKWKNIIGEQAVNSVYIGGGTPSILTAGDLQFLFDEVLPVFNIDEQAERTIEINPKTIDVEKLGVISQHINRISLGVQSFSDSELSAIGRAHNADDAFSAIEMIQDCKINFSLDLIFGLPGQKTEDFGNSLDIAFSKNPHHISLYSLMLVKDTKMHYLVADNILTLPSEETVIEMWDLADEKLSGNGYSFYEVANAALDGYHSRHNLGYWLEREYIGLGCSASSYYGGFRRKNTDDLNKYIQNSASAAVYMEKLSASAFLFEGIMMGLRLKNGFDVSYLEKKTGLKIPNNLHDEIIRCENTLKLSDTGFKIANSIIQFI